MFGFSLSLALCTSALMFWIIYASSIFISGCAFWLHVIKNLISSSSLFHSKLFDNSRTKIIRKTKSLANQIANFHIFFLMPILPTTPINCTISISPTSSAVAVAPPVFLLSTAGASNPNSRHCHIEVTSAEQHNFFPGFKNPYALLSSSRNSWWPFANSTLPDESLRTIPQTIIAQQLAPLQTKFKKKKIATLSKVRRLLVCS